MINEKILSKEILEIAVPNIDKATPEEFTLARRSGLGGSDSSIVLGVNKWTSVIDLVAQKRQPDITEEELEVGQKPQVRMGNDLEPLILQKFTDWSGIEVHKPTDMFRFKKYPYLTMNYDGVTESLIPVECKCISMFADKVWKKDACISEPGSGIIYRCGGVNLQEHIYESADSYGIPPYYYTQCQQEMMGVDAPYCYLAALFVKDWTLRVYKIFADKTTQDAIIEIGREVWEAVNENL